MDLVSGVNALENSINLKYILYGCQYQKHYLPLLNLHLRYKINRKVNYKRE